jgi:hypothetical protein
MKESLTFIAGFAGQRARDPPDPIRTQKLNRVPFPTVVRSSATRTWESWQPTLPLENKGENWLNFITKR